MNKVTRNLEPDYTNPGDVLNEILYFQSLVAKNIERINNEIEKPITVRLLKRDITRYKRFIAADKKLLNQLIQSNPK